MVTYISWKEARARVVREPVIFAEVMIRRPEGQKLEVHVMMPSPTGPYEVERDDTGRLMGEEVDALIASVAAEHGVRYATIRGAEDDWPPEWLAQLGS